MKSFDMFQSGDDVLCCSGMFVSDGKVETSLADLGHPAMKPLQVRSHTSVVCEVQGEGMRELRGLVVGVPRYGKDGSFAWSK